MPLTTGLIEAAVERYQREFDRYEKLAKLIGESCRTMLEDNNIRGAVQWRAKHPDRLRMKLQKYLDTGEHADEFTSLDSVFRVLKDLSGARVTTYVETDRIRVVALVQDHFSGTIGEGSPIVPDVKDQPAGFYRATHCLVRLKDSEAVRKYQNLRDLRCEVQICSQLAHVYNEIEHDLRYKPLSGSLSRNESDLLNALARLMEVGDTIINHTREAIDTRHRDQLVDLPTAAQDPVSKIAAHIRRHPALGMIADAPRLLQLAHLTLATRPQLTLPQTPAALYEMIVHALADGEGSGGPRTRQFGAEELLDTVKLAAWRLFCASHESEEFDQCSLLEAVIGPTCSPSEANQLVNYLVELGFLDSNVTSAGEYYRFSHNTLRDFLAAWYISSLVNRDGWADAEVDGWRRDEAAGPTNIGKLLDSHAFESSWELLEIFSAVLLVNPLPLITILLDRSKDDLYRHRLGLLSRCYQALDRRTQAGVARDMPSIFTEVMRIARRCESDDFGHRKPWLEWVERLLPSPDGAQHLREGSLALNGRYRGWAVSLKVLELFDRVLVQGSVPRSTVDAIAALAERDEHQWGVNTASLALRLSDAEHRQQLLAGFVALLEAAETSDGVRIRLAETVAAANDAEAAPRAGQILLSYSQNESIDFESRERVMTALLPLLETALAPIAAPILVNSLMDPSSRHHFWLAWRIIGKAQRERDSPWSATFLAIILFADRDDDQRLKLRSAQVLTKFAQPHLRDLGLRVLEDLSRKRESRSWVHAARWLVEHGPSDLSTGARQALLDEASDQESHQRCVATAELLEMGAVDPLGGPIRDEVHQAVVRELEEHGRRYGSRIHITLPGVPKANIDLELLADNPAAVIKLLHSFHGPSPYIRDRDDPNEDERRDRFWTAKLLFGTRYWPDVVRNSMKAVAEGADPDRDGSLGIVLFAASASELVELLRRTMERGHSPARTRHYLLEELDERGWRFQFRMRQIDVLRQGCEWRDKMSAGNRR